MGGLRVARIIGNSFERTAQFGKLLWQRQLDVVDLI